ncbi:MAG: hypothetical protein QG650_26 [Patescibacteria group bacterium]|nr:hypothetical protein [Patescibacteria group bacterium]
MNPILKEQKLKELWDITSTVRSINESLNGGINVELLTEPIKKLSLIEDERTFLELCGRTLQMLVGILVSAENLANYIRRQNDQLAEAIETHNEKKELEGEGSQLNAIF